MCDDHRGVCEPGTSSLGDPPKKDYKGQSPKEALNLQRNRSQSSPYKSCIRVHGVPLLPPLIDDAVRAEIEVARRKAVEIENKLRWRRHIQNVTTQSDPGVTNKELSAVKQPVLSLSVNSFPKKIVNVFLQRSISCPIQYPEPMSDIPYVFCPTKISYPSKKMSSLSFADSIPQIRKSSSLDIVVKNCRQMRRCFSDSDLSSLREIFSHELLTSSEYETCYNSSDTPSSDTDSPVGLNWSDETDSTLWASSTSVPETEYKLRRQRTYIVHEPSKFLLDYIRKNSEQGVIISTNQSEKQSTSYTTGDKLVDDVLHQQTTLSQEMKLKAATIITAAVRGFLVRRLLATKYVKDLILTIEDTLHLLVQLQQEPSSLLVEADIDFYNKLSRQLMASCTEFYDIFFNISISERMEIIRKDREKPSVQKHKWSN